MKLNDQGFISRLNKYAAQNDGLVSKALTTAAASGGAFIPENLEQVVTDTVIRLSPELAILTPLDTGGAKTHEFNQLDSRPDPGGAMGESATTPVSQSASSRQTVDLKIVRRKGQVTNFLEDTSRKFMDTPAWEMQNHLQSHVLDLINYISYGNKDSKSYVNSVAEQVPNVEFDGLDKLIVTNRNNEVRGGTVPTSLKVLDDMIDASNTKGGAPHQRVFRMSPQMLSLFSRLETTVRKTKELDGNAFGIIEVPGGWRLATYRGIPIVETTNTRPIETMRPTVTLGQVATGGGLSDGTYYVQVAPITYEGEQLAKAESSIVVNGGGAAQYITIQLSAAHTDANGNNNCFAYKIYVSQTSGTETLNKIVPAFTYDSNNAPVALTTAFNGDASNKIRITSLTPTAANVPTLMQNDVPLVSTGGISPEIINLWDIDPIQGLGKLPFTNTKGSAFKGLVTTEPLAKTDDFLQFLLKSYTALCPSFEATSYWSRGHRVE